MFSVGVNEGSPQVYPTDPLHACIVFQIHTRKGRAPVRRPLSASLSDEAHLSYMYAIACCCCRVPLHSLPGGFSGIGGTSCSQHFKSHVCVPAPPGLFTGSTGCRVCRVNVHTSERVLSTCVDRGERSRPSRRWAQGNARVSACTYSPTPFRRIVTSGVSVGGPRRN